ncbi:MAG: glycerate kinase [Dehalococcoidia bacterium]|jgi:glycerate kinase
MKIIIAPQGFKGSLKAHEAAAVMAEGARAASGDSEIILLPVADGGEGTVKAMVEATGGRTVTTEVHGPLGDRVMANWGVLGDGKTAVIEMAAASGLNRISEAVRDAMSAGTRGTGELILAALEGGYRSIIIGLGDSATTDGGSGMAQALGIKLLDKSNHSIPPGGKGLLSLERIDISGRNPLIPESKITCACDVSNPLYGPHGAAYIYGPQKGAGPEDIELLDAGLRKLAGVIKRDIGKDVSEIPGGGAAGGLAAGLVAFLDASLRSGIDIVCEAISFENHLERAGIVLTGEGRIDSQTPRGKSICGIAARAKKAGVPVIAFAGELGDGYREAYQCGIDRAVGIMSENMEREYAMKNAPGLLRNAVKETLQRHFKI